MAAISTGYFNFSSGHQGTSSRGIIKAQGQVSKPQIPMRPSIHQWLFSFTVFLQGNTGSSFSKDIQEAVQNNLSRVNAPSIHLGNNIYFNTVWIHQDLSPGRILRQSSAIDFTSHR
ncbi:hypothetical protein O181_099318, partial [Austropuccinia psidii MF-1]|nr:hypothetical protein [Austropuccinia psidii MF-1]